MHRSSLPTLAIVVLLVASLAVAAMRSGHAPPEAPATVELPVLWRAPEFRYRDQHGEEVTSASLAGQIWIADFVYTQCRTVCPLLTAKMVELQRRLAGVRVRFVSFSVDPAHDSPEVLAAYAARWAPDETRWTLLATDEASLPRLAAGFKVTAERTSDPNDPILHSSAFLLVDGSGQVRGAFDSNEGESFDALERSARELASGGALVRRAELPTTGEGLYRALACDGCHDRPDLAPPLVDLPGKRRELEDGRMVTADAAWVRESIVAPDAKRVRGYPLRMPAYAGLLDEARLAALARWVLARKGAEDAGAGAGEATVEEDPVCHMQVRVTDRTPFADVGGRRIHFCSDVCRDRYLATPAAFARPTSAGDRADAAER